MAFENLLNMVDGIECPNGAYGSVAALKARIVAALNNIGGLAASPVFRRTTVIATVNNTAVVIPVSALNFPLLANTNYLANYYINIDGLATSNFRFNVTAPAGAAGYFGGIRDSSGTPGSIVTSVSSINGADLFTNTDGAGSFALLLCNAIIINGANAGNVVFSFAQASAGVGDTNVNVNSLMTIQSLI